MSNFPSDNLPSSNSSSNSGRTSDRSGLHHLYEDDNDHVTSPFGGRSSYFDSDIEPFAAVRAVSSSQRLWLLLYSIICLTPNFISLLLPLLAAFSAPAALRPAFEPQRVHLLGAATKPPLAA